jgi:hypothetical protein
VRDRADGPVRHILPTVQIFELDHVTVGAPATVFQSGTTGGLRAWLRLGAGNDGRYLPAVLKLIAITWLPMAILSAAQGDLIQAAHAGSFLSDYAVHARFLIAIALLVVADGICLPRLDAITQKFANSGFLLDSDRPRFDAALQSTARLLSAQTPQVVMGCAALAVSWMVIRYAVPQLPQWHRIHGESQLSVAGWWHVIVSYPVLLALQLRWGWRLILWTRMLWLISSLNLRLLPSHPDRAAGLLFIGYSVRAWALLAAVPGVIASGTIADRIISGAPLPLTYKYLAIALTALAVAAVIAPIGPFSRNLIMAWRRGTLEYGALAAHVGHQFETAWLRADGSLPGNPLETEAFSATTDLYQVVSNVYEMRLIPVDNRSLVIVAVTAALPYLPLVLITKPMSVILQDLADLLF